MPQYYNQQQSPYASEPLSSGIQYIPEDDSFQHGMMNILQQKEQKYDQADIAQSQAFAGVKQQLTASAQDEATKNQKINDLQNGYNDIVKKHNGDLASAQSDIIKFTTGMRNDPFWKLNDVKLQQVQKYNDAMERMTEEGKDPYVMGNDPSKIPIHDGSKYSNVNDFNFKVAPSYDYNGKRDELWEKALKPEAYANVNPDGDFQQISNDKGITDNQVVKKSQYIYNQYKDNRKEYEQEIDRLQRETPGMTAEQADKSIKDKIMELGKSKEYNQENMKLMRDSKGKSNTKSPDYDLYNGLDQSSAYLAPNINYVKDPTGFKDKDFDLETKSKEAATGDPLKMDPYELGHVGPIPNSNAPINPNNIGIKSLYKGDAEKFDKELAGRMNSDDKAIYNDIKDKSRNEYQEQHMYDYPGVDPKIAIEKAGKDFDSKLKSTMEAARKVNNNLSKAAGNNIESPRVITYGTEDELGKGNHFSIENVNKRTFGTETPKLSNISGISNNLVLFDPKTGDVIEPEDVVNHFQQDEKLSKLVGDKKLYKTIGDVPIQATGELTYDNPIASIAGKKLGKDGPDDRFLGGVQQVNVGGQTYYLGQPLADPKNTQLKSKQDAGKVYQEVRVNSPGSEITIDPRGKKKALQYDPDTKKYNLIDNELGKETGEKIVGSFDNFTDAYTAGQKYTYNKDADHADNVKSMQKQGKVLTEDLLKNPTYENYKNHIGEVESAGSGGYDAYNKTYGTIGKYQFLPSTLESMGFNPEEVKHSPQLQEQAMDKYNTMNIQSLRDTYHINIDPKNLGKEGVVLLAAMHYSKPSVIHAILTHNTKFLDRPQDVGDEKYDSIAKYIKHVTGINLYDLDFSKLQSKS